MAKIEAQTQAAQEPIVSLETPGVQLVDAQRLARAIFNGTGGGAFVPVPLLPPDRLLQAEPARQAPSNQKAILKGEKILADVSPFGLATPKRQTPPELVKRVRPQEPPQTVRIERGAGRAASRGQRIKAI